MPDNSPQQMASHHTYRARCHWTGDTGLGWDSYDRRHTVSAPPAAPELTLTTGEDKGDPSQLNPEQLLVIAASSCQLLSFLHVAAKARIEVIEYEDDAEGVMPEDHPPMRVTTIVLKPRIVVREGPSEERVRHLAEAAHHECYIANSLRTDVGGAAGRVRPGRGLRTDVRVEPRVEFAPAAG